MTGRLDGRQVAYELLRAVSDRDAYANLVLPTLLRQRRLARREAALASELGYGTLRAQGSLDAVLARCADRRLDTVEPAVLDALRLGAYQLLRTRIPAHAAVGETVELAPSRARGFVNAVLRRVARNSWPQWLAEIAPADPVEAVALRADAPAWIVLAYADALGGDLADAEAALTAGVPPPVHLVARPGRIGRDDLLAIAGPEAQPGPFSAYAVRLAPGAGDPGQLAAVRDGRAGVQDEGSQLVAVAAVSAPVAGSDRRWLDAAAGPGGKAAVIAALAAGRGARLLAADVSRTRAALAARALRGLPADVVVADVRSRGWRASVFDRVLLDAPCTGLGALRRRPELRWRRKPGDLPRLAELQRAMLAASIDAVRPGGVVLYATCSPHIAETRVVVADVVASRGDVTAEDARPLFPGVPELGPGPHVQLWPHRHGTDAMFAALLRRLR